MTQLALIFAEAEPEYVDVCVERGWDDKHQRPWSWRHTLSRAHAGELVAEAPLLWPGARAWTEAAK